MNTAGTPSRSRSPVNMRGLVRFYCAFGIALDHGGEDATLPASVFGVRRKDSVEVTGGTGPAEIPCPNGVGQVVEPLTAAGAGLGLITMEYYCALAAIDLNADTPSTFGALVGVVKEDLAFIRSVSGQNETSTLKGQACNSLHRPSH